MPIDCSKVRAMVEIYLCVLLLVLPLAVVINHNSWGPLSRKASRDEPLPQAARLLANPAVGLASGLVFSFLL